MFIPYLKPLFGKTILKSVSEREEDNAYLTSSPLYQQDHPKVLQIPEVVYITVLERKEDNVYLTSSPLYQRECPKILQILEVLHLPVPERRRIVLASQIGPVTCIILNGSCVS
ncbi:hypothetical protein AMTR_s00058p00156330 [Amborella trichopoda]|uniref:Uncharacterized protein n=1 Tax=Amborella trichopoda TaxID=13333 RepID=W1PFX4_AMBTC|nr:hypothetical protein AMTR_s00058p00156330 [Amborella trichopoda]